MHHRTSGRFATLSVMFITAAVLASAQTQSIRIGRTGAIELGQPTRFGTALLQPGHYEVQHAVVGDRHYVVVRQPVQMNRRHTALTAGPEVARVPCRVVILDKPARFSFAYWTAGADGTATITEIRIADEPAGHVIALRPAIERVAGR